MKFAPLHASLMTLALFAGPAVAGSAETAPAFTLAQAEAEAPAADIEQIRKFLAAGRDLSRLDDERLQQRLTRAKRFQRTEGLPPELAQELEQEIAQLNAEIERRQQAAAEPPAAEQPAAEAPAQPEVQAEQPPPPQPEPEQQAQPEPQPEPQPAPQQQAAPEAPQPPPEVTQQAEQTPPPAPEAPPEAAQQGSDEVALFLQSVKPANELGEDELRSQMRRATELAKTKDLSPEQRRALRDVIREARAELRGKGGGEAAETETPPATQQPAEPPAQPQPPAAEQPAQQQAQTPAAEVDPALERQARALLADDTNVREMNRRELRKRLSEMRDLLASEKLSPETREALRKKLASERQILRREVSEGEVQGGGQPPAQGTGGGGTVNNNVTINNTTTITNTDIQVALRDRRPPDQLDEDELVRRIDIYRDVVRDERYDAEEREAWRRALERDRRYLRRQMLAEREERAARLSRGDFEFEIEIGGEYDPRAEVQDDVFAAEVEDEELVDVLVAPPRRKVERRYTVEEIERSAEARDAVARIEIDTVHFGFGEGFLREEEIDKLDRIAQVLERILAKNPDEVFLLEGHTDAVGSAGSNLTLSRQRAQAVKEALTTYYVIPAENLRTVGLGERYLKIPTQQAEAENRRVSLARITALVGQAD
jgi:outer membrane protein OmpA-like peptidoglycan-associated protein